MPTTLATLDDVAAVAGAIPVADEDRVTRLLEMVSADVIGETGQLFAQVIDDVLIVHPHDGYIRLPQHPVTDVASVVINGTTIDPAAYEWKANGVLLVVSPAGMSYETSFYNVPNWQWPSSGDIGWPPLATTVTYTHGYVDGEYPSDIARVVAEVASTTYLHGPVPVQSENEAIDGYSDGKTYLHPAATGTMGWSASHKRTLDRYRRSGFVSVRIG